MMRFAWWKRRPVKAAVKATGATLGIIFVFILFGYLFVLHPAVLVLTLGGVALLILLGFLWTSFYTEFL